MTPDELLNPNLHLTFTVKLDCDNKHWRENAALNADGSSDMLRNDIQDALRDAVEGVLRSELGKESTAFADYTCEVVDDDKTPIYAYRWGDSWTSWYDPAGVRGKDERECTPMRNGEELPYTLRTLYVLEREAVTHLPPEHCHPEEGHYAWRIDDENGNEIDSGEGCEDDCQIRFEEIMEASK